MASDDREYGNPFYAQIITANDDCRSCGKIFCLSLTMQLKLSSIPKN